MGAPKKPISKDPFSFSNTIHLENDLSASTCSYDNNASWSMPNSLAGISHLRTETGWLIDAGNGNDLIDASTSTENNRLSGGNGNDTIVGGSGVDSIGGGNGNDQLTGGAGADVFAWSSGHDTINDLLRITDVYQRNTIDFEDLDSPLGTTRSIVDGYRNFFWENAVVLDTSSQPNSAFGTATNGDSVASFINGTELCLRSSVDPLQAHADFDFVSGEFGCAAGTEIITIKAIDDNAAAGGISFSARDGQKLTVDFENMTVTANFGDCVIYERFGTFSSIDTVYISSLFDTTILMDNIKLNSMSAVAEQDKIDLPDGFDVAAYVATATDDGAGNTVLTNGTDSLTLVGVHSADVSADWFI